MELNELLDYLSIAGVSTSVIVLGIGIFRLRTISTGLKSILLLSLISICADLLIHFGHNLGWGRNVVSRCFTVSEFTLTSLFFFFEFTRRLIRIAIFVIGLLFIFVAILDYSLQGMMKMDSLSMGIEAITFITYSLTLLFFMLKDMHFPNILATPNFWVISGVLLYFGGCIFIFICSNYVSPETLDKLWVVHDTVFVFYNILISIGIWKARTRSH